MTNTLMGPRSKETLLRSIDVVLQVCEPGQLRAVAYLRVSTEDQKKGYGIAYSGKRVVKRIAEKGWAFTDVYADEGVSGSLQAHERDDLSQLMQDARRTPRPFDMVVVYEARAIGRAGRAFWPWVWELEDLGVYVHVTKKNYDNSTAQGRSQMRKDQDYAEEERELIRERTQGGIQEKAEEGGWPGGRTPYGWKVANKGQKGLSKAVRDDDEHAILRRAFELMTVKGKNAQQAALTLNSEDLLTREGKPWSNKNLLNKLKSEAVQHGRVTFRKEGRAKKDREGKLAWGTSVAIPLEPAFTEDELKQLNAALALGSVVRNTEGAPEYPYSKRIVGMCGKHYTGFHRPGIRGYRCAGKQPAYAGAGICSCSQVDADALEAAAWAGICETLGDADKLKELAREYVGLAAASKVDYAQRIKELDGQIEELSDTIDTTTIVAARQAARRGLKGPDAAEAAERAVKPLEAERVELEKQRAEAASWQAETEQAEAKARDLEELAKVANARLDTLSASKRSRLISLLDIRVTFTSPVPARTQGRPAPLPSMQIEGRLEPRLLTQHMGERSRAESWPHVPSGVIRFRVRVAASLTRTDVHGHEDRRAA